MFLKELSQDLFQSCNSGEGISFDAKSGTFVFKVAIEKQLHCVAFKPSLWLVMHGFTVECVLRTFCPLFPLCAFQFGCC